MRRQLPHPEFGMRTYRVRWRTTNSGIFTYQSTRCIFPSSTRDRRLFLARHVLRGLVAGDLQRVEAGEQFPMLGRALGGKRIPDHYFGYSSASDNEFDEIQRLMRISILVRENLDLLRRPEQEPTNETEEVAQVRLVGEPPRTSRASPLPSNGSPGDFMRRPRRSWTHGHSLTD